MNSLILTPTPNIDKTLEFYKKLNFTVISEKEPCIVSDGIASIEIDPDRYTRAGVRLYSKDWSAALKSLELITTLVETNDGYLLSGTSGIRIELRHGRPAFSLGKAEIKASRAGIYAGLSLETISIDSSMEIWRALGFSQNSGSADQGWVSMGNPDGMLISLMKPMTCPHLFFNPSLTFFNNGENLSVIEEIRNEGIEITEEITMFNEDGIADNIIIRDPGGLGFFIFND